MEHNQSVKITEDVSPDAATAKIDMDNEKWVDDPSCLDLNQVKNNIQSETSKEFLHQKLHPGNESGENKDSDRSAIHDISHQLPSTCHNVQDKHSVESLTHSQTSSIGRIQEVSSVAVQQDSNVKPLGDQVLPVTDDQWLKTVNSSDSRTEILSFAGKTKVNNVSSDISATFPQRSESPQRTVTPDDVRRAISDSVPGGSATDFTNPSTEAADISEDKILENAPEDMEGPVLENQNSQDYDLKKASRQPIFEVLSGMLNSSTSDMTAEIDKEQVCSAAEEKAKDNNVTACHTNTTNETHLPERVVDGKCTNAINKSTRNTVTKNGISSGNSQNGGSCDLDKSVPDSSKENLCNIPEQSSNHTPLNEQQETELHDVKKEIEDDYRHSLKPPLELGSPAIQIDNRTVM